MMRVSAKTVNGQFWEPKTKVNRVVPISCKLREYLDRHISNNVDGNWFFPTPHGKRWDADNVSRSNRKANN